MKKDYYTLLLWQGVLAGSCFWIPEIGWLFTIGAVALIVLLESALAQYAKSKNLQVFGTPFHTNKYMEDASLLVLQLCFTIALAVVALVLLSGYALWSVFWIMLVASLCFLIAFCLFWRARKDAA